MSRFNNLKPTNRHILVVPHFRKEEDSQVLLPEDYRPVEEKYIPATVVDIADDCNKTFRELKLAFTGKSSDIIVHRAMIEEVKHGDKTFFLVLENHVLGILENNG